MKKKQPQAASQQRRQPATNPKVRLKRSGGSAGEDSGRDAKKVSSPVQSKSPDLAVLAEKKRPRSRNPRSEVATIGDDAGVDPAMTKKAGSADTATRSAASATTAVVEPPTKKAGSAARSAASATTAVVEPPTKKAGAAARSAASATTAVEPPTKKDGSAARSATTAVVEPPVAEKARKGTKVVRRNTEKPSVDEKKPAVVPVVRSLRNRAVVFEVVSIAVQKDGGGLPDSTVNTSKPENKVSTEVDVGGAESLSPRRGRKRGRSDDSVEVAEAITAVEPTKAVEPKAVEPTKGAGTGSGRVVSKQRKPKIPLPPRRPTRSSAQDEVSVPAPDVSIDERMAKKQKLDSAASTKSVPSEATKGKVSAIEEAPRRPTRSAIHNEVSVPAFVAKENVSAIEEAPRRSRRSSSIYNPSPAPASVVSGDDEKVDVKKNTVSGDDEKVDTKKKQSDKTVSANLSPSEAKKEKASVPEEPPKRSTRSSAHIEVSVPAPVVSAAGERAGKKKADSEVEKGKLLVLEEPPRRSTRSSTVDVPGDETPLPESDTTVDDKKVVKKNKRGREITPPKISDGELPVVKELPRRSRRSSIGGLPADEISLPAFDIPTQEEKVVEKKVPGKRVPNRSPKTEAPAAPVEAPKVKIPKLEVSPRRATRMSICPVPKHDSPPETLGDDNISFNKKEKGKQAKKFQPVKKTVGNPIPKVEATTDAEKVHRGKVSEYVKPLRKPTLKKESGAKQAQKQRRAREASESSARTSKEVTKTVEVPEESQKAVQPEKPLRRTRHTARDVDVSKVRSRKSGDDEVLPRGRGRGMKRQAAEVALELKEQVGNKRQKQSGRWSTKDRSHLVSEGSVEGGSSVKSDTFVGPEADDGLATDLSTVPETETAASVENDDLPERTVSEMQQSALPDPIAGNELKEPESCKSQEENLHVGLDDSPDSENQSGQIEVLSITREISVSEVVVASVVASQDFSNVEVAADTAEEAASDDTLDFKSNVQCSNAEKEVGSSSMSHIVYVETTGTPTMSSSCISPGKMISDEASPAILTQDCSNVAINVDMARDAASDDDLDFKSDVQEAVKEVDSHTMPHVVYVEPISTPVMDGSCIAPVETISNEVNVEGNETTYTVGIPLSLSRTKDLPLPEKTEANTESENEEPDVPAFTHVAAEISSQLNSCSPVQASCHQEKNIGLLADSKLTDLSGTRVVCSSEASPVKNDDAKESIEQASCHQEKSIGILAESADSNLEELRRSEVRAFGEASAIHVESEDGKESVGLASCHQEKSIGLLADSADGNLAVALCTQVVGRSEVEAFGAALTTMLDAHSPVKSEDAKESIGQASCHQGKGIDNQVGEASTTMSDPLSPVKGEDTKESIGQASYYPEKSIGNQVDEAPRTMSDPRSPVKSEDEGESIGQASGHSEKCIGLLAELTDGNLAELSCTPVVPGSEVPGFGKALPTILGVHPPVKNDDVKESIGQASCHQEKSIELPAEPADGNLELSSTQVAFRGDAQEFSEALPNMLDVQSPVKNDDVKESIGQASYHQENNTGLLAEPEDGNLAKSQDVFASEVQEFGEALTTAVHAHSPMKSDDAEESIGHVADVTFAPREVSFGEGIGAEMGTNEDAETESKVPQTLLQNLGSDECSDDQFPNNEPWIPSENTPNDSLIVIGSSSAQKPNLLKAPIEDREPSSSKSFGEGVEIEDIVLEVAETLNTEVIVDDRDDNSLPHADAITMSGDGFGNVGVTDLDSVPKSMAGDTSLGEVSVVNEGDTLPFSLESKFVEQSEPDVVCTQVVDADPYESANKFLEFTETVGVGTQVVDAETYASASKVEYVETEVVDTQVVDEEPYESASKVEYVETEVVDTQVVEEKPYDSTSKFVEYTETEIRSMQVVNAGPEESASKVVEYVKTEVANTRVVDEEPYESANKLVEHTEAEVVSTQVIDAEPYESASKLVEHTEAEVVNTQVIDAEPYESTSEFVEHTEAEVVSTQVIDAEPYESAISGTSFSCGPAEDVEATVSVSPGGLNSSPVAKAMNVTTTSGERSTEDENIVPLSLSVDREFDKHTEIRVLSRDVTDAEPYESTIHGIGNSTVGLPNDDGDKFNGVTRSSGTSSCREPGEDVDVVFGSSGSIISPLAEDKAGATSAEKLSADNKDGPPSLNMDIKFDMNAETQVFSSHFVGTEPHESIDAIQSEGDEGAPLSCGASEHGGSRFTDVLPFGDGDKYNEGTQTVALSFICESAEHSDGNAIAVLATDDSDKCIEGTSNVSASISYGATEQSVNILTEVLPYEGDCIGNEIAPTVGASVSCGPIEHDTNNLTDVLPNEDGDRCNEVTVTADASLSFGAATDVGNIVERGPDNLTDVLPYEVGDNLHEGTPSPGPVDASFPSRPAEEGVGNIIEQDLNSLTYVLPYEGADDKCNEVTTTAEDAVGNIIDQDLDNLTDVLPYEATPTYCASFSSRPAEEGVGNIDQDPENLPDVLPHKGDDKCNEVIVTVDASSSKPAEDDEPAEDVGNIMIQDLENLPVLPDEGDNKFKEATVTVDTFSSGPAVDDGGNIINQDLENLSVQLPDEGDNKCNEATVTVDALSPSPAEDGVGNVTEQDLNDLTDELPDEGGSECNKATVTVDASLSSRPLEEGGGIINDVPLYADNDECIDGVPTVGESISSGHTEHGLGNLTDVLPFVDSKNYNVVTSTVGASFSCTPTENVDGNFTDVLRYGVGDKSNEGTSTFGASSCRPVEHDVGNVSDESPHDEGYKSNEGTSPVGISEDLQVTALGSPGGFDDSSVVEAMAGTTSELRLDAKEEFALPSLSVDSQIDKHTETQVLSVQVADAEPYDSTIHGNFESGDKCDEVTSYVGTSLTEVVEVTAMEVTAEEDLDGSKISSDPNALAFVTSEEELNMRAVNAEPRESARLGNNEGDDQCNEVTGYVGTSGLTEAVESIDLEVSTTVEVTTMEVTTVEVTTVEVTTVEVTDVEDTGLKITSGSNVTTGATSEGELNMQVAVAEHSESTGHGNNDGGDNCDEVTNYADASLSSGPAEVMEMAAVEDSALKTSSDLNVTTDAISVGELGMQDADAEPSETTTHCKNDVADKCDDIAVDVGSSFSPSPAEAVEVTAADDPDLEISSDSNVMAGVPSEVELNMPVAEAEPFVSAIHGNSEGSDKRDDVTSHVGTSASEPAEVDVIAVEDPGLNMSSDSNVAVGVTSTGELTPDNKE